MSCRRLHLHSHHSLFPRGGYFKNGDSHLSPISHFSNTMWEMGCKFSWFPFLTSKFPFLISEFQFLTSEFSLPTSHFWNPTSPFWFVVWTILFSSNLSQLEVGSGKWEMGSKKWEMGSKKWDVGIHNNLDILEWEMGPREVGNGTQTRILIFKISSSEWDDVRRENNPSLTILADLAPSGSGRAGWVRERSPYGQ